MKVRGWLMVGDGQAARSLPPEMGHGFYTGRLPDASQFSPGQWVLWAQVVGVHSVCLVCVDVPL